MEAAGESKLLEQPSGTNPMRQGSWPPVTNGLYSRDWDLGGSAASIPSRVDNLLFISIVFLRASTFPILNSSHNSYEEDFASSSN